MPYKNVDHPITCPMCDKKYTVKTQSWLRKLKSDPKYAWLCNSCRSKIQMAEMDPEKKKSMHEKSTIALREKYKNMSEEEKEIGAKKRRMGVKNYWEGLTEEEYNNRKKEMSIKAKEAKAKLTEEERNKIGEKISKSKKEAFANMTPEEYEAFVNSKSEKYKKWWAGLPEEIQNERMQKATDGHKKWWASLDNESQEMYNEKMHNGRDKYFENLSEEEFNEKMKLLSEKNKIWRENLSEEERQRISDNLKNESNLYWSDKKHRQERSEISKKWWASKTSDEIKELIKPLIQGRIDAWNNMSPEERYDALAPAREGNRKYWDNMTDDQYINLVFMISQRSKEFWASLSEEDKSILLQPMQDGFKRWYYSKTPEEKAEYANNMSKLVTERYWSKPGVHEEQSKMGIERWKKMTADEIAKATARNHNFNKNKPNNFELKFENAFNESHLINDFKFARRVILTNEETNIAKEWDYGIYDIKTNELVAVIDMDGARFHADNQDYTGDDSREYLDERRGLSIPNNSNIKHFIINEKNFKNTFEHVLKSIYKNYDEYVEDTFRHLRAMPFPYPHYTDIELMKSYRKLSSLDTKLHFEKSMKFDNRLGDRLIQHFHNSIWHDHRDGELSPYEAWQNDDLLHEVIRNRIIYQTHLNPNKVLQGFNVSKIGPKVSVFSAGKSKLIISKYLNEFDTIFDPFSGYSGRMLGAISLGKRYIGQDISERHVAESNNMMEFLRKYEIKFDAKVSQRNILKSSGKYQCLFTCPPYSTKEQWEDVPVDPRTCDDWIDECIKRFDCERYVFIVDHTEKYKEFVVGIIDNHLHFGKSNEYIIVI